MAETNTQQQTVQDSLEGWKFKLSDGTEYHLRHLTEREIKPYRKLLFGVTAGCWNNISTGNPTSDGVIAAVKEAMHYVARLARPEDQRHAAENFFDGDFILDVQNFLAETLIAHGHWQREEDLPDTGLPKNEDDVDKAGLGQLERLGGSSEPTDQPPTITPTTPAEEGSSTTPESSQTAQSTSGAPATTGSSETETPPPLAEVGDDGTQSGQPET